MKKADVIQKVSRPFSSVTVRFLSFGIAYANNRTMPKERMITTMSKKSKAHFIFAAALFLLFVLFTVLVSTVDVKPIGPEGSTVGLASVNQFVFSQLGFHPVWYTITDWLGVIPILFAAGFAAAGFCQLLTRKSIRKVDSSLLILGGFYLLVFAFYLFFERVVINYRPVMLGNTLEVSYPSSHTMLALCIMATAAMQLRTLCPDKRKLCLGMDLFSAFHIIITVVGRLISGVHWFTDIIGGLLLSAALVSLYRAVMEFNGRF